MPQTYADKEKEIWKEYEANFKISDLQFAIKQYKIFCYGQNNFLPVWIIQKYVIYFCNFLL